MVNKLPPFVGFVKVGFELFVGSELFVVGGVGSGLLGSGAEAVPQGPLSRRRDNGASLPRRSSKFPSCSEQNQTR